MPAEKLLTYAEYLELERTTMRRHEFLDGRAWMMAGGTPRHSRVKVNLVVWAGSALGDGPCLPYDSDMKVRVPETGLATYPDLSIVCGPIVRDAEDRNALVNPTVVAEVLSPSTEAWDRGEKFHHLRKLPTLRHVLFIDPDRERVDHYRRDGQAWMLLTVAADGELALDAVGLVLPAAALFRNLPARDEEVPA